MGRIILLFNTLIIYTFCFSQNKSGLITYDIKYPNENKNSNWVETRMYFNDTLSISTAFSTKFYKKTKEGIEQDGEGVRVNFKYGDEKGEIIYRNFKSESIVLRFPNATAFNEFTVEDTWLKIDWKIQEDKMKIGIFNCKKAIGNFRGRTFIVWFTEEIPLPYGPWKLYGLPGLILQAEDTEKMFTVNFRSIEYPTSELFELKKPIEKETKTLKEYVYAMDNYEDLLLEKLKSKLPREMASSLTKMTSKKDTKRTYKVEKIFEWEK
jgi:GLPGLI family protein